MLSVEETKWPVRVSMPGLARAKNAPKRLVKADVEL
jgi:hypothetical protein